MHQTKAQDLMLISCNFVWRPVFKCFTFFCKHAEKVPNSFWSPCRNLFPHVDRKAGNPCWSSPSRFIDLPVVCEKSWAKPSAKEFLALIVVKWHYIHIKQLEGCGLCVTKIEKVKARETSTASFYDHLVINALRIITQNTIYKTEHICYINI